MSRIVLPAVVVVALTVCPAIAVEPIKVCVLFSSRNASHDDFSQELIKQLSNEFSIKSVVAPDVPASGKTGDVLLGRLPSPTQIIEFGKKFDAKMSVSLEVGRDGKLIGFTIHEIAEGLLLADGSLADDAETTVLAKQLSEQIRRAKSKIDAEQKTRLMVSVIYGQELSLGSKSSVVAFTELLERRLSDSPTVAVASRSNATWRSAYGGPVEDAPKVDWTIGIAVAKCEDSKLTVTATIQAHDEHEPARVTSTCSTLDTAQIADMVEKIWQKMDVPQAIGDWQVTEEARRFDLICESLWAQNRKAAAFQTAEVALMLDPKKVDLHRRLSVRMLTEVERSYPRGVNESGWNHQQWQLFACRAFKIERVLTDRLTGENVQDVVRDIRYPNSVSRLHSMFNIMSRLERELDAKQLTQVRADHAICVTRPTYLFHKIAKKEPSWTRAYSLALGHHMYCLCHLKLDEQTPRGQPAVDATIRWLTLFDELPDERKPWNYLNVVLRNLTKHTMIRDVAVVEPLFKRLDGHSHPLVNLFGRLGRLNYEWEVNRTTPDRRAEQFHAVRVATLKVIDEAQEKKEVAVTSEAVRFLDESFNVLRLRGGARMADEMMATAEELMTRKLLDPRILLDGCAIADESNCKRAHTLLTTIVARDYPSSKITLGRAEKLVAKLEDQFPELRSEPRESPVRLKQLFNANTVGGAWTLILHPIVQGESVHMVVLSKSREFDGSTAQLISVPFDGGDPKPLGSVHLSERYGTIYAGRNLFVTAGCVDQDSYFAAIRGLGIVEFDLREPRASTLVPARELPKGYIQSMVFANSQIYAGMEGGKLIRLRPMTRTLDKLAATDVAVVKTPLDDRPPFSIPYVLHDSARKRLLIVVKGREAEIWEHDLKTASFALLQRLGGTQSRIRAKLDRDVLTLSDTWVFRWNLETGDQTVVANYSLGDLQPTRKLWIDGLRSPVFCKNSVWWFNSDRSLGRFTFPDGDPQTHFINDLEGKPIDSSDSSFAHPIDDNRFLIYHAQRLWLTSPVGKENESLQNDNKGTE